MERIVEFFEAAGWRGDKVHSTLDLSQLVLGILKASFSRVTGA